jgi:tetratricopeptide (TPR) repeat protein
MSDPHEDWERSMEGLWATLDAVAAPAFVAAVERMAATLPAGDPVGLFERACSHDSTGDPARAVPLYQAALAAGLTGLRRRRASIQLASSLRNLGDADAAARLLAAELAAPPDALDDAVRAFLALALADLGREREALSMSLDALSRYLPRYNRSLARYAAALVAPEAPPPT